MKFSMDILNYIIHLNDVFKITEIDWYTLIFPTICYMQIGHTQERSNSYTLELIQIAFRWYNFTIYIPNVLKRHLVNTIWR